MKKALVSLTILASLLMTACAGVGSGKYEKQFVGTWAAGIGDSSIIYSFSEEDGEYKASLVTGGYDVYLFDKYTATETTITLYQEGKNLVYSYSFEDGYLHMDGILFKPFD